MLGKGLPKGQGHGDGLNGEWQRTVYQEVLWAVPASMMSHHHQMMLTVQQKSTPIRYRLSSRSARLLQVLGQATCLRELQNEGLERMTPNILY